MPQYPHLVFCSEGLQLVAFGQIPSLPLPEEFLHQSFWLVALYLEGAQLSIAEGELGTKGADEFQELSFASLDQPQASLGSGLLHQVTDDWVECISHPLSS
uniref:SNF1-related protein kinase catalytic subunit alpha KIN10-like isoform X1 n=1 Tax=Rhizophora mucronata TaxID=61149 RepID=A0A2P2JJQ9_RHIMU